MVWGCNNSEVPLDEGCLEGEAREFVKLERRIGEKGEMEGEW